MRSAASVGGAATGDLQPLRTAVVLAAALFVQVGLGGLLKPPAFVPFDLFLVLTVYYAGTTSPFVGTLLGALLGLAGDALSPHRLVGRQSFAFALVGYLSGKLNAYFVITAGVMKVITVFAATYLSKAILSGLDVVIEGAGTFRYRDCFREALVNALVAPVLMGILARWHRSETNSLGSRFS